VHERQRARQALALGHARDGRVGVARGERGRARSEREQRAEEVIGVLRLGPRGRQQSVNANVELPAFAVGRRTTLHFWSTQITPGEPTNIEFALTDVAGNVTTCDPVFTSLRIRRNARRNTQTFVGLPQAESKLIVRNKRPG
jgi:hypothetical protein